MSTARRDAPGGVDDAGARRGQGGGGGSDLGGGLSVIALVAALLVVAAVGVSSPWTAALQRADSRVASDFQILHAAGRGVVEGRDIHDPAVLDELGRREGRPATPFCAANPLVVRTYGLLADQDLHAAYRLALYVNVALALAAIALLAGLVRLLGIGHGDRRGAERGADSRGKSEARLIGAVSRPRASWMLAVAIGLAALGLGEGLWMSLAMNTTNLLALVALLAALHAACKDRPILEGVFLAVAIVAKTSPALMLLIVVLAGRRWVALWSVAALLVLGTGSIAWSGWALHESWLVNVLPMLGYAPEVAAGSFNNSLHTWNLAPNGVLSRAMVQAEAPRMFAWLGAWLVAGLVIVQLRGALRQTPGVGGKRGVDPLARVHEYALGATAMLLLSSVTWPHHLVLLAIPSAWLLWRVSLARSAGMASTCVGLLCVVVLALPLGVLDASPDLGVGIPVRTAALVVLFAALAMRPGSGSPDSTSPEGVPS